MSAVTTEKELARAVSEGQGTIIIEGDLAKKTIQIKATGNVAWAVAIGAIGVAVCSLMLTAGSGGASTPVTGTTAALAGGGAVAILGGPATVSAISIAVAAGGVGVLKTIRHYKIAENTGNRIVLKKR
ncbi:hypothetical protein ACEV60_18035 [Enterobacter ludwigii]|uniref:hypothetical protein n=1 Tax=Enterobacteriaceae TaxID=543 RepID=UPI00242B01A6|nr:hypothetical protein [Enterobacter ludwigii]WGA03919.1 hypothetical protein NFK84_19850 [Enterobacter ludwigii]